MLKDSGGGGGGGAEDTSTKEEKIECSCHDESQHSEYFLYP